MNSVLLLKHVDRDRLQYSNTTIVIDYFCVVTILAEEYARYVQSGVYQNGFNLAAAVSCIQIREYNDLRSYKVGSVFRTSPFHSQNTLILLLLYSEVMLCNTM